VQPNKNKFLFYLLLLKGFLYLNCKESKIKAP